MVLVITGKSKDAGVIRKGDVIMIAPDVVHWHGATAGSSMTHIAVNTNTHKGIVNWLEPAADDQYKST